MHTHQIQVAGGREAVSEIRRQLFVFSEVLDVLASSRADSVVVVFSGRPRPAEWNGHLRDLGYQLHPRHAKPSADAIAPSRMPQEAHTEPPAGRSDAAPGRRSRARRRRHSRAISDARYLRPFPAPPQPRRFGTRYGH